MRALCAASARQLSGRALALALALARVLTLALALALTRARHSQLSESV